MDSNRIFKFRQVEQSPIQSNTSSSNFIILNSIDFSPEKALYKVGARVYTLQGYDHSVRLFVFGCQGDGLQGQKKVARLMNDIAAKQRPDLVLVLGDNMYDNGVSSPDDKSFKTRFDLIYDDPALLYLQGIPYFLILGNHDGNYHQKAYVSSMVAYVKQGREVEKNQVIHTYLADVYGDTQTKIDRYVQTNLDLNMLQPWNMPYFYYSLIIGDAQLFCINSNSYPKDYLALVSEQIAEEEENQARWLKDEYLKAKQSGRKIILALHHPLFTEGKRAEPDNYDSHHYFSSMEEIDKLNTYLSCETKSYNELLRSIFVKQDMQFDLVLAAHDHFLSYYNNKREYSRLLMLDKKPKKSKMKSDMLVMQRKEGNLIAYWLYNDTLINKSFAEVEVISIADKLPKVGLMSEDLNLVDAIISTYGCIPSKKDDDHFICQLKPGGGGGKLQGRVNAKDHPYVGCCLENHGFATITFEAKQPSVFNIDIYSTEGHHLKFNDHHHLPIRESCTDLQVERLRHAVLAACDDYLFLLREEELQQKNNELTKKPDSSGVISYLFYSVNTLMKYIRPNTVKIIEMKYADNLMAYFNQPLLPDIETLLFYVLQVIDQEKLKNMFVYWHKSDDDKVLDPQFESSFFYILFKKLIFIPELGDEIKIRWLSLIDLSAKLTAQNFM